MNPLRRGSPPPPQRKPSESQAQGHDGLCKPSTWITEWQDLYRAGQRKRGAARFGTKCVTTAGKGHWGGGQGRRGPVCVCNGSGEEHQQGGRSKRRDSAIVLAEARLAAGCRTERRNIGVVRRQQQAMDRWPSAGRKGRNVRQGGGQMAVGESRRSWRRRSTRLSRWSRTNLAWPRRRGAGAWFGPISWGTECSTPRAGPPTPGLRRAFRLCSGQAGMVAGVSMTDY